MEWNAACSLLAGVSFGLFVGRFPGRGRRASALMVGLSVMTVGATASLEAVNQALRLTEGAKVLDVRRAAESDRALQFVRDTAGPLVSYDLTLLVKAGREVPIEPFIMYELIRSGDWDPQPFIDELERCEYRALISTGEIDAYPRLPARILDVVERRYPGRLVIGSYVVYLPIGAAGDEARHSATSGPEA
jgi:hypothetical protein